MKLLCVSLLFISLVLAASCSKKSKSIAFDTLIDSGKYESALKIAEDMAKKDPGDTDVLNRKALALIYLNREEEALITLDEILSVDPDHNDALTNKSWALYNLDRIEEAHDTILKALDIEPNTDFEYVNYGNALLSMDKYPEAEKAYSDALALNSSNSSGIYGLGCTAYWLDNYEEAITQFNNYLWLVPADPDAIIYLGYSNLYSGKIEEALENVETLKLIASSDRYDSDASSYRFSALKLQAECELEQGDYSSALETLTEAEKINTDDKLYSLLGEIHYDMGNYSQSVKAYDTLAASVPDLALPHIQNVYNYLEMENFQSAYEEAEEAMALEPENPEALNAMGNVFGWDTCYRKAFDYFQQAVQIEPDYLTAHVNSMWALYNSGLYRKCVEYGEALLDEFPYEPDIYGYLGDSWAKLYESDKAVKNYKKAYEYSPDAAYYDYLIAMEYFIDQQYDLAEAAINDALKYEPENDMCLVLKEEIESVRKPLSERIADFVEQNYLYADQIRDFDEMVKTFSQTDADASDAYEFVEKIRLKDDLFTFCLIDEDYDEYWDLEEGDTVFYDRILEDTGKAVHYFDIDYFGYNTANQFIEKAEELENKEDSILVIDLRDNGGGLMESCAEILDYLLGYCSVGSLIYRDGSVSSWYSDKDAVEFEEIFILVNQYTASSSEMLTLGLKKYLPNVTIVGEPTYGKGVGQTTFDSREQKIAVLLVNFYWNVREENLVNSSIKPDIKASGELSQYLSKVKQALKN